MALYMMLPLSLPLFLPLLLSLLLVMGMDLDHDQELGLDLITGKYATMIR